MSAQIGFGYGSEFHLLRYLGRYRKLLTRHIEHEIGGRVLEWLDHVPGDASEYSTCRPHEPRLPDHEYVGLEFLKAERPDAFEKWHKFWPGDRRQQNWDAIAIAEIDGTRHWILVEAKAHLDEISSNCGAGEESIGMIRGALEKMSKRFSLRPRGALDRKYYQFANRLAALYFLLHEMQPRVPAKLVFAYFHGDQHPGKVDRCPSSPAGWQQALQQQYDWIGFDADRGRDLGVHTIHLDVVPNTR